MVRPLAPASVFALVLACSGAPESPAPAPGASPAPAEETSRPESPSVTEPAAPVEPTPTAVEPPVEAGEIAPPIAMPVLGPSGWEYEDHELSPEPLSRGTVLDGDVCGLTVALAAIPSMSECEGRTLDERIDCMRREYTPEVWLDEDDAAGRAAARAQTRTRLMVRDAHGEISMPAYPIASVACLDGVAIVVPGSVEFSSRRSFVAIETRDGSIVRAREVSIRDPHENDVDCGNAWDGVELLPIVDGSSLAGSLVRGAGASPRFALGVGEVGQSGVVDSYEPVLGYRLEHSVLVEVPSEDAHFVCPIVVSDGDGNTNVRPLPNTGRAPVGTLPNGTRIDPVEQRGRWYRISEPVAGWVYAASLARRCEGED